MTHTLEWGEVLPKHWQLRRLKHVCEVFPSNVDKKSYEGDPPVLLCNYTDVYYNDRITRSLQFMEATATAEQIERFSLRAGDTIITKDSETPDDIAIAAYVPEDLPGVVCGYHLAMVRPRAETSGAFIKWWFGSRSLKASVHVRANGLTRVGLGQYDLDNLVVPVPPLAEQTAIAAFLDRETGKIDALVEEQRRLIELLKEKRQAVISHAVTKGLDPNAKMKPSGAEWLGDVPEHWEVKPLKWMVSHVVDCLHTTPTYEGELLYPAIRTADVERGVLRLDQARLVSKEIYLERIQRLKPEADDVLYSREGERFGMAALVPEGVDLCLGQRMMMFRTLSPNSPGFLMWALNSEPIYQQVLERTAGAMAPHANISDVINFRIPCPNGEEQLEIANELARITGRIDDLVSKSETTITLLGERRAALISAAVTGKIDVRATVRAETEAA